MSLPTTAPARMLRPALLLAGIFLLAANMRGALTVIEERAPVILAEYRENLRSRINEILADKDTPKGIMFLMDVDHFKSINDTFGHDVGDRVIYQLGSFLGKRFVDDEIAGRFGGDEFIVFIKDTDDQDVARNIAEDIISGAASNITLPDENKKVSVSIGIAIYNGAEKNYSEIFKKADTALYRSKADPENRVCVFK